MGEQAIHSYFNGDDRVSVYPDGTLEIQSAGESFRGTFGLWIASAKVANALAEVKASK